MDNLHQFWYKEDNRLFLYTGKDTSHLRRKGTNIEQTENFKIKNGHPVQEARKIIG